MNRSHRLMPCLLVGLLLVGAGALAQAPDAEPAPQQSAGAEPQPEPAQPAADPATPPAGADPADPAAAEPGEAEPGDAAPKPLPPDDDPLPYEDLVKQLRSRAFWLTIFVAVIFGGLGGLVYELLMLKGAIELPNKPAAGEIEDLPYAVTGHIHDLGVWARVIIGGLAAIAAVWLLTPQTGLGLAAGALIAGSAGTSVFRALQDRLLASLAVRDAANVRVTAQQMQDKVEAALVHMDSAQAGIVTESAAGDSSLAEARRLLAEARGIGQTLGAAGGGS